MLRWLLQAAKMAWRCCLFAWIPTRNYYPLPVILCYGSTLLSNLWLFLRDQFSSFAQGRVIHLQETAKVKGDRNPHKSPHPPAFQHYTIICWPKLRCLFRRRRPIFYMFGRNIYFSTFFVYFFSRILHWYF